jgi:transcriptional regulator with XRE-family HTH domain
MNRWPQQTVFAERVKEQKKKNGLLTKRGAIKMDVVADLFNINEDTLRQFLHDTTRNRPHINTLTHIASVLGCSVTEFIDAPSDPPPGMSFEQWGELTARERTMVSFYLSTIVSDALSVAEKEVLYNNFQSLKEALLQLKQNADT